MTVPFNFSLRRLLTLMAAVLLAVGGMVAYPSPASADFPAPSALVTWWNQSRGDNFAAGNQGDIDNALRAGYTAVRREGNIYTSEPETRTGAPLILFWHPGRQDNFSTATPGGIRSAESAGYVMIGIQGYVETVKRADNVPLYQFWHQGRQDNFVTATQAGIDSARSAGYVAVRIEGYVMPYNG